MDVGVGIGVDVVGDSVSFGCVGGFCCCAVVGGFGDGVCIGVGLSVGVGVGLIVDVDVGVGDDIGVGISAGVSIGSVIGVGGRGGASSCWLLGTS